MTTLSNVGAGEQQTCPIGLPIARVKKVGRSGVVLGNGNPCNVSYVDLHALSAAELHAYINILQLLSVLYTTFCVRS